MAAASAAATAAVAPAGVGHGRKADWISAICVVTFDLELGQALEVREWKIQLIHFTRKLSCACCIP